MSSYFHDIRNKIDNDSLSCLFKSNINNDNNGGDLLFTDPVETLAAYNCTQVETVLSKIDEQINKGFYAAGYLAYEAGYGFEEKLFDEKYYDRPLALFGIYNKPHIISRHDYGILNGDICNKCAVSNLAINIKPNVYYNKIAAIKEFISQGDVYQINFTYKYKFNISGDTFALFIELLNNQNVNFAAYVSDKNHCIISLSPELFFKIESGRIYVKPMKGTSRRGRYIQEDINLKNRLMNCLKNKAENTMIIDLMRNDIGKISVTGSVKTENIFEVETYSTLFQMTSAVNGILDAKIGFKDIFKSLFPSGSVTGAPKIRAMEIIKDLEQENRGIYTGSIGYITPEKFAQFNVAIRTIYLNKNSSCAELGVGSGIVADSVASEEFEECKLKSTFLTKSKPKKFSLIETLLLENNTLFLREFHTQRLIQSAQYFNYKIDIELLNEILDSIHLKYDTVINRKVRIILDEKGKIKYSVEKIAHTCRPKNLRVAISDKRTFSQDIYLFHKTTNRELYNIEYAKYTSLGFFDVIFFNEYGQVTEGAISNVFIKKGDTYYTPPIDCGLLPGTYRRYLMEKKDFKIVEKILYKEDLFSADSVFAVNSVRKMVEVSLYNNLAFKDL